MGNRFALRDFINLSATAHPSVKEAVRVFSDKSDADDFGCPTAYGYRIENFLFAVNNMCSPLHPDETYQDMEAFARVHIFIGKRAEGLCYNTAYWIAKRRVDKSWNNRPYYDPVLKEEDSGLMYPSIFNHEIRFAMLWNELRYGALYKVNYETMEEKELVPDDADVATRKLIGSFIYPTFHGIKINAGKTFLAMRMPELDDKGLISAKDCQEIYSYYHNYFQDADKVAKLLNLAWHYATGGKSIIENVENFNTREAHVCFYTCDALFNKQPADVRREDYYYFLKGLIETLFLLETYYKTRVDMATHKVLHKSESDATAPRVAYSGRNVGYKMRYARKETPQAKQWQTTHILKHDKELRDGLPKDAVEFELSNEHLSIPVGKLIEYVCSYIERQRDPEFYLTWLRSGLRQSGMPRGSSDIRLERHIGKRNLSAVQLAGLINALPITLESFVKFLTTGENPIIDTGEDMSAPAPEPTPAPAPTPEPEIEEEDDEFAGIF